MEIGNEYGLRVRKEGTASGHVATTFCNYRMFDVLEVTSYFEYEKGTKYKKSKYKDLRGFSNKKAWEYVTRLVRKKAMQDASLTDKNDVDSFIETPYCNQGLGGRFKWKVHTSDVYDVSMAALVDKHYHVFNAVFISPDSWLDSQLQKAYYARRGGAKKDTNDQKTTSE